jgi:uncharacterized spore protein YtfJ
MSNLNQLILEQVPNAEKAAELLARLFDVAKPSAVFSEPVKEGEYTVINASEVSIGLGVGFGGGGGVNGQAVDETAENAGFGGGGGGGGGAVSRPVAAIIIGPKGVRMEPIVDVTKVALALFSAVGAFLLMLAKMRRFSRTGKLN